MPEGFADALVGRAEVVELWPFSQGELHGTREEFIDWAFSSTALPVPNGELTRAEYVNILSAGGFPEATSRVDLRRARWFEAYLTTLTEKVIRQLSGIERIAEIPRVLRFCFSNPSSQWNCVNSSLGRVSLQRFLTFAIEMVLKSILSSNMATAEWWALRSRLHDLYQIATRQVCGFLLSDLGQDFTAVTYFHACQR